MRVPQTLPPAYRRATHGCASVSHRFPPPLYVTLTATKDPSVYPFVEPYPTLNRTCKSPDSGSWTSPKLERVTVNLDRYYPTFDLCETLIYPEVWRTEHPYSRSRRISTLSPVSCLARHQVHHFTRRAKDRLCQGKTGKFKSINSYSESYAFRRSFPMPYQLTLRALTRISVLVSWSHASGQLTDTY